MRGAVTGGELVTAQEWEALGRPLLRCPECSRSKRTPETLRVHRMLAHGVGKPRES